MATSDLFRAVLICLATFLIGVTSFGAYGAWRDRHMPVVPERLPLGAVFGFVVGHVLLLAVVVVERWARLGERIGAGAWVSLAALVFQIVSMVAMIRSSSVPRVSQPPQPPAPE